MATKKEPTKIERRDFIKKTGAAAGVRAAGFPAIISGQSLTNSLKLGLVGCGGRGSGAAGQALTADPNNVLTAVADIDEQIAEAAVTRLKNSQKDGDRVKIEGAFAGLDAYDKVINSVDVVLLATPPGFRPQHLTAAVNANKHVFCEKPCGTDYPGVRQVIEAQKLAQQKNLGILEGF
jgi:myo-inositol 2-dehydrogenase/D-chiro-inositol 1-dehydrogenase